MPASWLLAGREGLVGAPGDLTVRFPALLPVSAVMGACVGLSWGTTMSRRRRIVIEIVVEVVFACEAVPAVQAAGREAIVWVGGAAIM